ncbi:MAG TPA: hypothetical protein EYP86_01390 [Candidatus Altiarchaeales archaeon]|nr:hypothetical protein [Candidatus Altiarchaeales archaeon]
MLTSTIYTNTSPVNCSGTATDPDGDNLNISVSLYNGSNLIVTCSWTNQANGTSWNCGMTNTSEWVKGNTINCTATYIDTSGSSSSSSTTKIVQNTAPSITTLLTTVTVNTSQTWTYDYNATDLDVDDGVDTLIWSDNATLFDINSSTGLIVDTPTESDAGSQNILITVSDGTAQDTDSFVYIVNDVENPSIQFVSPTPSSGSYSRNYIDVNVSSTEANIDAITVYLYNSTGFVQSNSSGEAPYLVNFTNLLDGTYYINATINDTNGNSNQTETRTILLDTTPPLISSPKPSGTTTSTSITLSVKTNEQATCKYDILDRNYSNMNNTFENTNSTSHSQSLSLSTGTYAYYVRCTDSLGNTNNNSTIINFTISTSGGGTSTTGGSNPGGSSTTSAKILSQPTCSDGKKNQDEEGVDCGGPCPPCVTTVITTTLPVETTTLASTTTIKTEITTTTLIEVTTTTPTTVITTTTLAPSSGVVLATTAVIILVTMIFAGVIFYLLRLR